MLICGIILVKISLSKISHKSVGPHWLAFSPLAVVQLIIIFLVNGIFPWEFFFLLFIILQRLRDGD